VVCQARQRLGQGGPAHRQRPLGRDALRRRDGRADPVQREFPVVRRQQLGRRVRNGRPRLRQLSELRRLIRRIWRFGRGGGDFAQRPPAGRRERRRQLRGRARRYQVVHRQARRVRRMASRAAGGQSGGIVLADQRQRHPRPRSAAVGVGGFQRWEDLERTRPARSGWPLRVPASDQAVYRPAAGSVPFLSLLVRPQGRQPFPGGRDCAGGCRVRHGELVGRLRRVSPRAGHLHRRTPHDVFSGRCRVYPRGLCQPAGSSHGLPLHGGKKREADPGALRPIAS